MALEEQKVPEEVVTPEVLKAVTTSVAEVTLETVMELVVLVQ